MIANIHPTTAVVDTINTTDMMMRSISPLSVVKQQQSQSSAYTTDASSSSDDGLLSDDGLSFSSSMHSVDTTPLKKRPVLRKQVRFQVDQNDHVKTEIFEYKPLQPKHQRDVYCTQIELMSYRCRAATDAKRTYRRRRLITQMENAFAHCATGSSSSSSNNNLRRQKTDMKALLQWTKNVNARGLEDVVSDVLATYRDCSKAKILLYQDHLRRNHHYHYHQHSQGRTASALDDTAYLLGKYCQQINARNREFAYKMGLADATVAKMLK